MPKCRECVLYGSDVYGLGFCWSLLVSVRGDDAAPTDCFEQSSRKPIVHVEDKEENDE
jgi:hypothetical protein